MERCAAFQNYRTLIETKTPQKEGPITILRETLKTKGVIGLYSGCTALVVGNATKAGVRFVAYDHFKHILADSEVVFTKMIYPVCRSCRSRAKSVRLEVFSVCSISLESVTIQYAPQLD